MTTIMEGRKKLSFNNRNRILVRIIKELEIVLRRADPLMDYPRVELAKDCLIKALGNKNISILRVNNMEICPNCGENITHCNCRGGR